MIDYTQGMNIAQTLNYLTEHQNWLAMSYKYKWLGVNISFDYNTPVPVQTTLNKLICNVQTPLTDIENPIINKNSMQLNMSRMGVKNFNFRLNRGNLTTEDLAPLKSTEQIPFSISLNLTSQLSNVNKSQEVLRLGTIKLSFVVAYWLRDSNVPLSNNKAFKLVKKPVKVLTTKELKEELKRRKELGIDSDDSSSEDENSPEPSPSHCDFENLNYEKEGVDFGDHKVVSTSVIKVPPA
jgi:hypothetical protein